MSDEIEALRNKNRELLDELKKARAKLADTETLKEDLGAAQAEVLELKLHKPVRDLLGQILIPPNNFSIKEVMEDYTFQLNDDGNIQMLDGDKRVDFTVEGVTEFLGGVEKYAPFTRSLARNETVQTEQQQEGDDKRKMHFGIR